MQPGKARSSWLILLLGVGLAGCAADRASVEKNLMADKQTARLHEGVAEQYRVGCPDVLEIRVGEKPDLSGQYAVGPNGRIDLGDYGSLRVEGRTLAEVAELVAKETGTPAETAQARVVEFRSQFVLLFGQVIGWQRTVPYQGQETVLDLLQRVGGITPGAEPDDVYVVRAHLGDNRRPEVFRVDLQAIVLKNDRSTNIRLLPFDQIYVGENRQALVERSFPPWLRPVYQAFWNMRPGARPPRPTEAPPRSRWINGPRAGSFGELQEESEEGEGVTG